MSIVSLKIIFVKKQKQTRERPTQGRGATFIITEVAVFTLEKDYSCETGYPFDDSRQIGNTYYFQNGIVLSWMNNPPVFWRREYPFQIACV